MPDLFSLVIAAAAIIGTTTMENRPIQVMTQPLPFGVQIEVVGDADRPVFARYTLAVTSGNGGGNRSVQSGAAELTPGGKRSLLSLHLGRNAADDWDALLTVELDDGTNYQERRTSSSTEQR
jgi:hypothetical protein